MTVSLTKEEYESLAEFRYRLRTFLRFSEESARAVGLTPNQHQLLLAVEGFPDRTYATPSELAERLQLKHNSCLGLIHRCEQAGYLYRFDNPHDRRSVFVSLTDTGRELLNQLTDLHKRELARLGIPYLPGSPLNNDPKLEEDSE